LADIAGAERFEMILAGLHVVDPVAAVGVRDRHVRDRVLERGTGQRYSRLPERLAGDGRDSSMDAAAAHPATIPERAGCEERYFTSNAIVSP
jgi:hypothetical protein